MELALTAFVVKTAGQRVEPGEKLAPDFGADGLCHGERCASNPQEGSETQQVQQDHRRTIEKEERRLPRWKQRIENAFDQKGYWNQDQRLQEGN